jgi:hypothetical protein
MRRRRRLIILIFIITTIILLGSFFNPAFNYLTIYLSKSEKVNANILLVEGWLPEAAIELASTEFKTNRYDYIITTGLKSDADYYELTMDGYLIFYPGDRFSKSTESGIHTISVSAYSELGGINCAHFNLFINDSLVSDFIVHKKKQEYSIKWAGQLTKIDSIVVQFDNDAVGRFGDRNIYVKDVTIDNSIKIPYLNNSEYDISDLDGQRRIANDYNSIAEYAAKRLFSMGIDSALIYAIPCERTNINRTLTSAIAVGDWLKNSDIKVEGINIISAGTHSRRTWMAYSKILDKSYKIGIISLPDYRYSRSSKIKFIKTLRETIAIVYYWLILIPY